MGTSSGLLPTCLSIGVKYFGGGIGAKDFGTVSNLILGLITLLIFEMIAISSINLITHEPLSGIDGIIVALVLKVIFPIDDVAIKIIKFRKIKIF